METSKDRVYHVLEASTVAHDVREAEFFQASYVAGELSISRSLASQYMNALFAEGRLVKVASRPVLFFAKAALEAEHGILLENSSFLSIEELLSHIEYLRRASYGFEDVIGYDGSLKPVFEQARAAVAYPPKGLPLMLVGERGTGRRTIRRAINRYCLSKGVIADESLIVTIQAERYRDEVVRVLFGDKERAGILASGEPRLVWIVNAHLLSDEQIETCLSYFDFGRKYSSPRSVERCASRLFFELEGEVSDYTRRAWGQSVPAFCQVPAYHERALDEKEAWAFKFLRREEKRIGRPIQVSASVIRRLTAQQFADNLDGLTRVISMSCASALTDQDNQPATSLRIFSSHLPAADVAIADTYPIYDEPALIDVDLYDPASKGAEATGLLTRFMRVFEASSSAGEGAIEARAKNALSSYFECVGRSRNESASRDYAAEAAISDIARQVFERHGVREPVNFSSHFLASTAFFRGNQAAVSRWHSEERGLIRSYTRLVTQKYATEFSILTHLKNYLQDYLGWKIDEDNLAIFAFYLHWYLRDGQSRVCRGIIVAHGYSTANSIADSVNTMLGEHVFDAIDMPLDVQVDKIIDRLERHVSRAALPSDMLVMVDMGSLERIGSKLSADLAISTGVINNVSTALALEAGSMISRNASLQEILEHVRSISTASYSLNTFERQDDCIVFVSENGAMAATRLADLFIKSLPRPISVSMVTCDYFEFVKSGGKIEELRGRQPLFVFGALDPHLPDTPFVSLEGIAEMGPGEESCLGLNAHLSIPEVAELRENLIRNFSLESLMNHLTILEPTRLMETVSSSIEQLQSSLGYAFSYSMRLRFYIHISYLVERLVTKDVLDYGDEGAFARDHADFIYRVRSSFAGLAANYGVDLPIGEINYLYDLIEIERAGLSINPDENDFLDE